MSLMYAYKKDGVVYMATDTRRIYFGEQRSCLSKSAYKIQKLDNNILLGIVCKDKLNVKQSIFSNLDIFTLDKKGNLTKEHIIKKIFPKLFKALDADNVIVKSQDEPFHMECVIVLAYQDKLYKIDKYFNVLNFQDYLSEGNMSDYGFYEIANAKKQDNIEDVLVKALDTCAKFSKWVGAPYLLINTKDLEYKLIKGDNKC